MKIPTPLRDLIEGAGCSIRIEQGFRYAAVHITAPSGQSGFMKIAVTPCAGDPCPLRAARRVLRELGVAA